MCAVTHQVEPGHLCHTGAEECLFLELGHFWDSAGGTPRQDCKSCVEITGSKATTVLLEALGITYGFLKRGLRLWTLSVFRFLPSFLEKMVGHDSNRDTTWLEVRESLVGCGLAYSTLKFRGLNIICSVQWLVPLAHTPVHPHMAPSHECWIAGASSRGEHRTPLASARGWAASPSLDGSKRPARSFLKVAQYLYEPAAQRARKLEGWRKWWINPGWVLENSEMALTVQGSRIPTRGRDVGLSSALLGLSMVDSPAGTWSQPTVFWDFFSPGKSVPAQFSQQTSAGGPVQYCLYRLLLTSGSSPQGHMC